MKKINLRDLFPEYNLDCYIEVPDADVDAYIAAFTKDVADVFIEMQREKNKSKRKIFRNGAYYSLDLGDGIGREALYPPSQPHEIFEQGLMREQLYVALISLPDKQRERVCAHFFLGLSKAKIANTEGVADNAVKDAIYRALKNLEHVLKKYL